MVHVCRAGQNGPVLILTRTSAIRYLNAVTVAPITTTIRDVPSEVQLSVDDGMMHDCAVNFYNLQTVPKTRVGAWITTLSLPRMGEVDQALQFALGIDPARPPGPTSAPAQRLR